jgi:hypothetical protein
MTVRVHAKPGHPKAVGLGLAAVLVTTGLLTAGCGAATPGTADYAGGPVSEPPTHLSAFPMPDQYVGGATNIGYKTIAGTITGTTPRQVHITVASHLVLWLGCAGTAGSAVMSSPLIGLRWTVPCGNSGDPEGIEFAPKKAIGEVVKVLVTAPAAAKWEARVDAPRGGK